MTEAKAVTATFTANQNMLSVNKIGQGTVISNPTGINCGETCSALFGNTSVVNLTATPAEGWTFAGWSGDCTGMSCQVTMSAPKMVTATFTSAQHQLAVNKVGQGTVTSTPAGINCGTTCSALFNQGTVVTLTAQPAAGWSFAGWSGACSGLTCQVTMSQARMVTATFTSGEDPFRFDDVPDGYWAEDWIYRLHAAGVTIGCSQVPPLYCPEDDVTRAEMAVFLERGKHGAGYLPPQGTGTIFADVLLNYWAVNWIEQLYADKITVGCATNPLRYCPDQSVSRAEMAAFLLRAKHGAGYTPPKATIPPFNDVPLAHWAVDWIAQLKLEGITTGFATGFYNPEGLVTRAEMAAFLVRTFELPELP
jgi:uncharacterized repeat protein (TIGR02543 family)